MGNYTTKYFGEISIDETSDDVVIYAKYKNEEIEIILFNCNIYGNKLKDCLDIIDKYFEINELAKKSIIGDYLSGGVIKEEYEEFFDHEEDLFHIFNIKSPEEFDINRIIEELKFPTLYLRIEKNEIDCYIQYSMSKRLDTIFVVGIDEKFKVKYVTAER
jgi:hypothetical protein